MSRQKQPRCAWCKAPEGRTVNRSAEAWRVRDCEPGAPWRNPKGNITTFEPDGHHIEKVRLVQIIADGEGNRNRIEDWKRSNAEDSEALALLSKMEAGDTVTLGGGAAPLVELRIIQLCEFCASHTAADLFEEGRRIAAHE